MSIPCQNIKCNVVYNNNYYKFKYTEFFYLQPIKKSINIFLASKIFNFANKLLLHCNVCSKCIVHHNQVHTFFFIIKFSTTSFYVKTFAFHASKLKFLFDFDQNNILNLKSY